ARAQPQGIDRMAAEANHGTVKGYADEGGGPAERGLQAAAAQLERAVEANPNRFVEARNLPRITPLQPIVGPLLLPAVADPLAEDSVFIAQAITHRWQLHGGHGIEEAGGKASQPTVAQPGVRLLVHQVAPVEAVLLHGLIDHWIEQEVSDVVGQRSADQELHRQVVDPFRVFLFIDLLGMEPSIGENVSNGAGESLKAFAGTGGRQAHGVVEGEMAFIEGVRTSCEGGLVETIPRQSLCNRHMIRQRPRRLSNPRIVLVHLGPNSSCHGRAFYITTEDYASTVARGLQADLDGLVGCEPARTNRLRSRRAGM